jgi:hypothetical protein
VVDLTARNLAMSTAMVLTHGRSGADEQRLGSERVARRCGDLLRQLDSSLVKVRLETLLEATAGRGDDVGFLQRWGYDAEQKSAIASAVLAVAD